jgi:uncharacterized protein YbcV (DUF1398 family)
MMNTQVMHQVLSETQAGKLTFPEVVRRLSEVGVESYFVDYATGKETLYTVNGETYAEDMSIRRNAVAEKFSEAGIVEAIRGAQADTIRYPEFVQRATDAGVIGYWAYLTGRKVVYFGRKGEMHTEPFPPTLQ